MSIYKTEYVRYSSFEYAIVPFDGQYFEENIISIAKNYFCDGVSVNGKLYTRSEDGHVLVGHCTHCPSQYDADEFFELFDEITAGVNISMHEQARIVAQVSGIIENDSRLARVTISPILKQTTRVRTLEQNLVKTVDVILKSPMMEVPCEVATQITVDKKDLQIEVPSDIRLPLIEEVTRVTVGDREVRPNNVKMDFSWMREDHPREEFVDMQAVTTDRYAYVRHIRGVVAEVVITTAELNKALGNYFDTLRSSNNRFNMQQIYTRINKERRDIMLIVEICPRMRHTVYSMSMWYVRTKRLKEEMIGKSAKCSFHSSSAQMHPSSSSKFRTLFRIVQPLSRICSQSENN